MKKLISLLWAYLLIFYVAVAQDNIDLESDIPVDPKVKIGTLDNGLTYYIRQNEKPENKVEMRLVVNAGSILEEDDQLGLAHFVEHMAFNGTKNFEKNELVSYLQSVGVKFGMHLNAYTSFDETVYILPIPSDSAEVLNTGLQILEDWAHNVSMQEDEIDKERGVVLEEWRRGRGADQRMRDQYFPVIFKNSRYAERLPIGKKTILESFSYESLRRFYNDWYRPDLMAVIAVGDIDVDEMEQKIRNQFGKIEASGSVKERPEFDVPGHEETYISIVTDQEASFTQVQLLYKHPPIVEEQVEDYRQFLIRQLYSSMINQRLKELQQKAEPPFIYGASGFGSMTRNKAVYQSFAAVSETGVVSGIKALVEENERVLRYGFTAGELERAKQELLTNYERSYNERDKTESRGYAEEYVRNFLQDEPIPGIEKEYQYATTFVPDISLAEVNQLPQKYITDENRVVVITAPEKVKENLPENAQVLDIIESVKESDLQPYVDELAATALMEKLPEPGTVTDEKMIESIGVTELTLSNDVKVVLKPTDFKNDQILMRAMSPGGSSLYPDDLYMSASNAHDIVQQSGVKDFSLTDLDKLLAGKTVSVSPFISTLQEGFSGSSTPKDFESMLQLIHLYFTAPRKDAESFESFISKRRALYKNLLDNPNYYYQDKLSRILTQDHPRGGGFPDDEDWQEVALDEAYEVYKDRFSDASDFIFFLVGNFDVEEIKPLLSTYLGSLPDLDREEKWKDLGIRPPDALVEEKVYKGTDPKSIVTLYFEKEGTYDPLKAYQFKSFTDVLNIKMTEVLREEKSGVYSAGARSSASEFPYEHYTMNIGFPCAPENAEDLISTALSLIETLQKEGPSEEDMQKIKETQRRIREENLEQNGYWINSLRSHYYHGIDPAKMLTYGERIDQLTAEEIQKVAQELIDLDEYVSVVLYPENYQEQ